MLGQNHEPLKISDVFAAERRERTLFPPSPLLSMAALNNLLGHQVYLKADCLLPTNAFKLRGAYNKISCLAEAEGRGIKVITASSGNHGMAVAYSAMLAGIEATVAVPLPTPQIKKDCIRSYHAALLEHGQVYNDTYEMASKLAAEKGYYYVHSISDREIIAGQGTISLELLDQMPDVEQFIVPIGGGGLMSGIAFTLKTLRPQAKLIGVMAEGSAVFVESRKAKRPLTLDSVHSIADAILNKAADEYLFPYIETYVDDILTVSDTSIAKAVQTAFLAGKLVLEGAGAMPLAAVLEGKIDLGKKTALMCSGGNIDAALFAKCMDF